MVGGCNLLVINILNLKVSKGIFHRGLSHFFFVQTPIRNLVVLPELYNSKINSAKQLPVTAVVNPEFSSGGGAHSQKPIIL